MAVPKKNQSHQRQHKRRANWKGQLTTLATCKNCGEPHRTHNICAACGYYNGRQYKDLATAAAPESSED